VQFDGGLGRAKRSPCKTDRHRSIVLASNA
jgi:hypothetical protein